MNVKKKSIKVFHSIFLPNSGIKWLKTPDKTVKISLFYLGIKKKRKTIVITKNLKKKDGKGRDLDHTAQIGEEEVDQGQKTGGDESQGQGNTLTVYNII